MVACQRKSLPNLQKYLLTRAERKVAVYAESATLCLVKNAVKTFVDLGVFQVSRENRNNVLERRSTFLLQSNRRKLLEFVNFMALKRLHGSRWLHPLPAAGCGTVVKPRLEFLHRKKKSAYHDRPETPIDSLLWPSIASDRFTFIEKKNLQQATCGHKKNDLFSTKVKLYL
ncbi:uncharacterized protein [Hyperolius riggenbachi]|uniref:uncharacterized protein isoform X1 n=1 Tax=Hyperolius riggenbachi TaxID=752182 RepID=UPI0035A37DCA